MNDISNENNLSQPTSSQINSTREEIEKEKREREHHREKFNAWLNNDYANVRKDNRKKQIERIEWQTSALFVQKAKRN